MQTRLNFGEGVQLQLFSPIAMLRLHKEYLLKQKQRQLQIEQRIQDDLRDFQELIRIDNLRKTGYISYNFSRNIAW